jgi:nitrite reductase/ring-hydroxylating ferredoxin subunit
VEDLPYPTASVAAMRVASQAQFHPRRYMRGLAERIRAAGGHLFEHTAFEELSGHGPLRLRANGRTITADHVVFATHQPLNRILLTAKVSAQQTYVLGARVAADAFPQALAWDTADPYHYWRQAPEGESALLLVGGEDHRTGEDDDTAARHRALEAYLARAMAGVPYELAYRWTGQILMPVDGVPLIGRSSRSGREYVGTGYMGNGMTMGTYAGLVIADMIQGRDRDEARVFDPGRWNLRGMFAMLRADTAYPAHLVGDRLATLGESAIADLAPGQGKVVGLDGKHVAVSRAADGAVHACSAVCTHMGCLVHWNEADASWDCPCHGSRFQATGEVITGPALANLAEVELPERVTSGGKEGADRPPGDL